jgi:DNA polymerase I-like protein with 3'-5' exonuclease and polymerase domains
MTKYILDIETTVTWDDKGKSSPSPYLTTNKLVSVGIKDVSTGEVQYLFFNHKDKKDMQWEVKLLQQILDNATLIIGHNLKFDMSWLYECGFKYDGPLYDTMIFEYVTSKGRKPYLSLSACAERYGLPPKKDILVEYLSQRINTDAIPMQELREYGVQDIETTYELYLHQRKRYEAEADIKTMWPATKLSMETLEVLIDIERAGIKIDVTELERVETQFRQEKDALELKLGEMARAVMGDTPMNFASSADMSAIVYSIRPKDKKQWAELFNIGTEQRGAVKKIKYAKRYKDEEFRRIVRQNCDAVKRTEAIHCTACDGQGFFFKVKKNGERWKRPTTCPTCEGHKVVYQPTDKRGGFGIRPLNSEYATLNGFSTDKGTIDDLVASGNLSPDAEVFLRSLQRVNALDTYLTSFVDGIRKGVRENNLCHPNFNQCVTATGRLSSSGPNFQNFPRGNTFPIRKVFVSRWEGGKLMPTDFAALEYRTAVMLARCEAGLKSILEGKDRHELSAAVIYGAIKEDMEAEDWKEIRQKAKSSCVPMYSLALTRKGWKSYEELVVGEDILAYDQERNINTWTPLLEKVKYPHEPVYSFSHGHNFKVVSTLNHRWYGTKRNWKNMYNPCVFTTEELNTQHRITTSAVCLSGNAGISPDDAALLAWLWTDGSIQAAAFTGRTAQAGGRRQAINGCIIQKKQKGIDYIEDLLSRMQITHSKTPHGEDGCFKYALSSPELREVYKRVGLDIQKPDKIGFVLRLPDMAREEFLKVCHLAEGSIRKHGQWRLSQNVGEMKEAMQLASYLSGYDVRVSIKKKEEVALANFDHATLNLRTRTYVTGQRLFMDHEGVADVWCPRTKYGTWVMRQGETITITGNTFQPLYGGAGATDASRAYAEAFFKEHTGIARWHDELCKEALTNKQVVTPSGRIFAFPDVRRDERGKVQGKTQLVNYPVQCVDGDTEFLSISGWKKIKDYKEDDMVAEYDNTTGGISFSYPKKFISNVESPMITFSKQGIDHVLTPEHRMVYASEKTSTRKVVLARDFTTAGGAVINTYTPPEGVEYVCPALLRLLVAYQADGTFTGSESKGIRRKDKKWFHRFHLSKRRKIDRLENLLKEAKVPYSKYNNKDGTISISTNIPFATAMGKEKEFTNIFTYASLTSKSLKIISDECHLWDGNKDAYFTNNKRNADFIQHCMAASGSMAVVRQSPSGYIVWKYKESRTSYRGVKRGVVTSRSYCFETQSGFWLARRGGCIFATGNSFATADLAWAVIIPLWREMKALGLQSKLVLQVHDDVVPDVHPSEVDIMQKLIIKHFSAVHQYLTERFKYATNVPIGFEVSIGDNLMEKKTVYKHD